MTGGLPLTSHLSFSADPETFEESITDCVIPRIANENPRFVGFDLIEDLEMVRHDLDGDLVAVFGLDLVTGHIAAGDRDRLAP